MQIAWTFPIFVYFSAETETGVLEVGGHSQQGPMRQRQLRNLLILLYNSFFFLYRNVGGPVPPPKKSRWDHMEFPK